MSPHAPVAGPRQPTTPRRRRSRAKQLAAAVAIAVLAPSVGVTAARAQQPDTVDDAAVTSTTTLATPVLSARRAPEILRSTIADTRIREAIAPLLDRAPDDSCITVSQGGRTLVEKDSTEQKTPASLAKLLTATAVLQGLDPNQRLTTTAASTAKVDGGVIKGDLFVIGGGDPLLTTRAYQLELENPEQLSNPFGQLADNIKAAGVTEIRGDVVGDDSRYSTQRWIPTWPTRYQKDSYIGPLGALMVNDGFTGFTEDPEGAPVGPVEPGDPAALAAATLVTLLEDRGITVTGTVRAAKAPAEVSTVATLDSLPLDQIVSELIDDSDNVTAELLGRELGLQARGDGSTPAGVGVLTETLAANGLPTQGLDLLDASGLDPADQVTCALIVAALDAQGRDSVVGRSLPLAGETGTLRKRMRGTDAQGNIRAKTGTLAEVNALAGFATTKGGAELTFAYILNGANQSRGTAPLDELAVALVGVPDGPSLDELGPGPTGA